MIEVRGVTRKFGTVEALGGIDLTIDKGKTEEVTLTPQQAGRYTVICDHFCGAGHGNMHLDIVVE